MKGLSIGAACISSVCYKENGFIDYRFVAARAAEDLGYDVIRNPEISGITQGMFDETIKHKNPIFILLVGNVESSMVKAECQLALEHNLPIFVFLRARHEDDKVVINTETQKILNEISQITFNGECSLFTTCEELYNSIKYRLNAHISRLLNLKPVIQNNRASTYFYATEQIAAAKKRVILSQKTSLLLLGPRNGNSYEYKTYETLLYWIRNKREDMQFLHLFCKEDTCKSFSSNEYDIETAKENLFDLINKEEHHNLTFRYIERASDVANLITDSGIQLVFSIADETFNMVIPYFFAPEDQLMKIISYIETRDYISYDGIKALY